jgi:hypothetical protein
MDEGVCLILTPEADHLLQHSAQHEVKMSAFLVSQQWLAAGELRAQRGICQRNVCLTWGVRTHVRTLT